MEVSHKIRTNFINVDDQYMFFSHLHHLDISPEARLYTWVEENYVQVRPRIDASETVHVDVSLTLYQVFGIVS